MEHLRQLQARYLRAREKRWFRWSADAVLFLLILAGISAWQTRTHLSGVPAPPVTLATLDGKTLSLDSLKGKPVLVAFWAPWCGVCKTESQNVSWTQRLVGDRAHVVSIVSSYDDLGSVQAYVRDRGVDYPVLLGDDALVRGQFRVDAFPTVYFLDADGRIKRSAVGYTTTVGLLTRLLF